jgi:hypothetical protein
MKKDASEINMTDLNSVIKHAMITITGDSDLVLNKMNARNTRTLIAPDRKAIREQPNLWEDLITAIHWRDKVPMENTYTESNEAMMHKLLAENAPCITAFGLKKSFGQTVVRTGTDKYSTSFDASLNISAVNGLVPVKFSGWAFTEQLMSPKRGAPVNVALNHFMGWEATFQIDYMEGVYSRDKLIDIINLAGFSIGIGSGRTSGYGRYHVSKVEALG